MPLLVATLVLALAACTPAPAASGQAPGNATVTVAMADEPQGLDPQLKDDGFMRPVAANIFESLADRAPDGSYVPALATEWKQQDTTTWRFTLRENVKFHNGESFNADAAVFSINRQIDKTFNSELLSYFTPITGATKVDDRTIDVTTDGYDPTLVGRLYWLRMMPPDHTGKSSPETLAVSPVGTGPYRLDSWKRGQEIRLVANADYWRGAPAIGTLVFRPIKESSSRLEALNAGEIDIATALLPDQASQAPNVITTAGFEHGFIRLNAKPGSPLESAELRQAMNYAIDKEALATELFRGFAKVETGQLIGPHVFGYNTTLQAYPYDPAKARQLVAASGYDGETIEIVTSAGRWPLTKEMCEAIVDMLGEVGIKATVRVDEFGAWLDAIFDLDNPPDAIHISETNEIGDPLRTIGNYYTSDGQLSTWPSAEADGLLEEALAATDEAQRKALFERIFQAGRDDPLGIFLLNTDDIYGVSSRISWKPRLDQFIVGTEISIR